MATWENQNWLIDLNTFKRDYVNMQLTETDNDSQYARLIKASSQRFESMTNRKFQPFAATRTLPYQGYYYADTVEDLLSISTITTENGAVTLTASDYVLLTQNEPPYWQIAIRGNASNGFSYDGDHFAATSVTGIWGYHNNAVDTGAELAANIASETATSATVDDGTLLSVGMHILINSEQMFIEAISTNTLTIARGINGTTAATHASADTVYVYRPPGDVEEAVGILAARLEKRVKAAGAEIAGAPENNFTVRFRIPGDVMDTIYKYGRNPV